MMAITQPARPALAAGAATLAALMPKCPLCVIAIVSALGLELPRVAAWLTPLTILFLSISLTLTAIVSRSRANPERSRGVNGAITKSCRHCRCRSD